MRHSLSRLPAIRNKAKRVALDPEQVRSAVTALMSPQSDVQTEDLIAWIKMLAECQTFLFAVYVMQARELAIQRAGGGLEGLKLACEAGTITPAMDEAQADVNIAVNQGKIDAVGWINRWALGAAR